MTSPSRRAPRQRRRRALVLAGLAGLSACSSDDGSISGGLSRGGPGGELSPDGSPAEPGAEGAAPDVPDVPPLTIESISPADGASAVALDAVIEVRFSAALDPATANESSVVVQGPNGPLPGELTVQGDVLRFTPASELPLLTPVRVSLGGALASADGGALAEPTEAQFLSRDGAFGEPVLIHAGAAASLFLRGNDAGNLIATWTDLQVTSSVEAMIFDSQLGTWTDAQRIEDDDQLAFSQPVAAVGPNGDSLVAWRGGGFTRYAGGWSPATVGQGIVLPSLALGADAALSVTNSAEGAAYRLLPNGLDEWSEPVALLAGARVDAIDTLAAGFIAVAASEGELLAGQLSEPGAAWSEFVSLASVERLERVRLATRGEAAAVAWLERRELPAAEGEEASSVSQPSARVFADGAWAPAFELPAGAELPWLSVDAGGRALAIWAQGDAVGASSFSPDQGWAEPVTLAERSQLGPSGAVDASGNRLALWASGEQIAVQRRAEGGEWRALEPLDSPVTVSLWSHVDARGRVSLIWQNGSGIWWTRFE